MGCRNEIGLGYCGIACVLCDLYKKGCPGCAEGIAGGFECSIGRCAADRRVEGCHVCPEYPCGENLIQDKRSKAFTRYIQEFGSQAFINRLSENCANGISYSTNAKRTECDDYDRCETEREMIDLLKNGRSSPR